MDTNFVGIPQEGYGVSNNNIPKFSKPNFNEASFQLDQAEISLEIGMHYF